MPCLVTEAVGTDVAWPEASSPSLPWSSAAGTADSVGHHRQPDLTEAVSLGRRHVPLRGAHTQSGLATCFRVFIPSLLCEMRVAVPRAAPSASAHRTLPDVPLPAHSPSGPQSFQQTDGTPPSPHQPIPLPRGSEQESSFVFEPQDIFGSIYYRTSITLIQSSLNGHNTFIL